MKRIKKFSALLLVFALCLGMIAPAAAESESGLEQDEETAESGTETTTTTIEVLTPDGGEEAEEDVSDSEEEDNAGSEMEDVEETASDELSEETVSQEVSQDSNEGGDGDSVLEEGESLEDLIEEDDLDLEYVGTSEVLDDGLYLGGVRIRSGLEIAMEMLGVSESAYLEGAAEASVTLMSTDLGEDAVATITKGETVTYGSWQTSRYEAVISSDVSEEYAGTYTAFCGNANKYSTSGNLDLYEYDPDSDSDSLGTYGSTGVETVDLLIAVMLVGFGGSLYNEAYGDTGYTYGNYMFTQIDGMTVSSSGNGRYAYTHALVSCLYSGSTQGCGDDANEWMNNVILWLADEITDEDSVINTYIAQSTLFVAMSGYSYQDFLWIVTEPLTTGYLVLTKDMADNVDITDYYSWDGYSCYGAVLEIYSSAEDYDGDGTLEADEVDEDSFVTRTSTTVSNADGTYSTPAIELEAGTYYVKEISGPTGYKVSNYLTTVNVEASESSTEYIEATVNEYPMLFPIIVYKTDEEGNAVDDAEFTLYISTSEDDKDAVELTDSEGNTVYVKVAIDAWDEKDVYSNVATGTVEYDIDGDGTDEILSGAIVFDNLPLFADYYLVETHVPDGYEIDETEYEAYIINGTACYGMKIDAQDTEATIYSQSDIIDSNNNTIAKTNLRLNSAGYFVSYLTVTDSHLQSLLDSEDEDYQLVLQVSSTDYTGEDQEIISAEKINLDSDVSTVNYSDGASYTGDEFTVWNDNYIATITADDIGEFYEDRTYTFNWVLVKTVESTETDAITGEAYSVIDDYIYILLATAAYTSTNAWTSLQVLFQVNETVVNDNTVYTPEYEYGELNESGSVDAAMEIEKYSWWNNDEDSDYNELLEGALFYLDSVAFASDGVDSETYSIDATVTTDNNGLASYTKSGAFSFSTETYNYIGSITVTGSDGNTYTFSADEVSNEDEWTDVDGNTVDVSDWKDEDGNSIQEEICDEVGDMADDGYYLTQDEAQEALENDPYYDLCTDAATYTLTWTYKETAVPSGYELDDTEHTVTISVNMAEDTATVTEFDGESSSWIDDSEDGKDASAAFANDEKAVTEVRQYNKPEYDTVSGSFEITFELNKTSAEYLPDGVAVNVEDAEMTLTWTDEAGEEHSLTAVTDENGYAEFDGISYTAGTFIYLADSSNVGEDTLNAWLSGEISIDNPAEQTENRYASYDEAVAALDDEIDSFEQTYTLSETAVPFGYMQMDDQEITINGSSLELVESDDKELAYAYTCTCSCVDLPLGSIHLTKYDENGDPLAGSVTFALYVSAIEFPDEEIYSDENGNACTYSERYGYTIDTESVYTYTDEDGNTATFYLLDSQTSQTTDENGCVDWENLYADGTIEYLVIETGTESGYGLLTDEIYVGTLPMTLEAEPTDDYEGLVVKQEDETTLLYDYYDVYYTISNSLTLEMPTSGAMDNTAYMIGTAAIIAGTAVLAVCLYRRKQGIARNR